MKHQECITRQRARAKPTAIKLSKRSKIPPWPGMRGLESLMLLHLFAFDSMRSPICAINTRAIIPSKEK